MEDFLKHFVKNLYTRTTHQHSRYLYDLTCRLKEIQYLDLWEYNEEIYNDLLKEHTDNNKEDCETNNQTNNIDREYYNHENKSFLCGSKFKVVRSDICNCWHTHVNHEKSSGTQECQDIGLYHPWRNNILYNNVLVKLTDNFDAHV